MAMNTIATLGEKAPLLQISDWVQGGPTNLDQLIGSVVLIEVFQVNCARVVFYIVSHKPSICIRNIMIKALLY